MSAKQSPAVKESLARIHLVYSELDKYLRKLPPNARLTMGDLAEEFAARFKLHAPDVRALISFYFHVKYEIGDNDTVVTRGRMGGIRKIATSH